MHGEGQSEAGNAEIGDAGSEGSHPVFSRANRRKNSSDGLVIRSSEQRNQSNSK